MNSRLPSAGTVLAAAAAAIIVFTGLSGCSAPLKNDDGPTYFNVGRQGTINGRQVAWTVSVPSSYRDGTAVPLILSLHYGGEPSTYYGGLFTDMLVTPALGKLGAIVLSPTCPVTLSWWDGIMEGVVLALIDSVRSEFTIDPERMLVTGFSFGGIGTWYYAGMHPELFSAAIPIASQVSEEFLDYIGDIPLYVIHSTADAVLPAIEIMARVDTLEARGADVTLSLLNGISHYQTQSYVDPLERAVAWVRERWR